MINRAILKYAFDFNSFPTFVCPCCNVGVLAAKEEHEPFQPSFSKQANPGHYPEYEHVVLRVAGKLVCNHASCGQLVVFSADGGIEWGAGHDNRGGWEEYFFFKAIHPAPRLIEIPDAAPEQIRAPLLAAFESFWNQKQLAANATRQAVEALLDHHQVTRSSRNGGFLPLSRRIESFAKTHPEHAELFGLFSPILNAGSHGDQIEVEVLLNVLEALEIHLSQVFDKKSDRLAELRTLLRNAAGIDNR